MKRLWSISLLKREASKHYPEVLETYWHPAEIFLLRGRERMEENWKGQWALKRYHGPSLKYHLKPAPIPPLGSTTFGIPSLVTSFKRGLGSDRQEAAHTELCEEYYVIVVSSLFWPWTRIHFLTILPHTHFYFLF